MKVCQILGVLLCAGALVAGGVEATRSIGAGRWAVYSLGEAWSSVHANSLIGLGSLIENKVSPDLWLVIGLPALNLSLWILLLVPGALAFGLCRGRRRRSSGRRWL